MGKRAKAGTLLPELVRLAIPALQEAERQSPRTGPGDKPDIPDWVMAGLIMIAIMKKKKPKSAQFRFLHEQRREIAGWLGQRRFPSRATYFRRYRRAHRLYKAAIRIQGEQAIAEGVVNEQDVAVDKSLIEALGPQWHKQDRQAGHIPAGADVDSTWGYSEHDGWVQGYSYEVVVSATPESIVFPLLASVDVASTSEARGFQPKIGLLPVGTIHVSADSGYDANYLGEAIEYDEHGKRTGRRFLCPENPRNNKRAKKKPGHADASRARSRELRHQRRKFLKSRKGRRIYSRRKKTVEPFNQWFKSLFELDARVWHRGLDNNRTQILAGIFIYQLLVRYNHRQGNKNGQVRCLLDKL
jgi:DDE family transposase